jgi:hypothetical protein
LLVLELELAPGGLDLTKWAQRASEAPNPKLCLPRTGPRRAQNHGCRKHEESFHGRSNLIMGKEIHATGNPTTPWLAWVLPVLPVSILRPDCSMFKGLLVMRYFEVAGWRGSVFFSQHLGRARR